MRRNAVTLLAPRRAWPAPGAARAQSAPQPMPADRSILTAEGNGHSEAKPDFARITAVVSAKGQNLETRGAGRAGHSRERELAPAIART